MFLFRQILGNGNNPSSHHIHIFSVLAMDFGTPLAYKLALIHRLMGGEIVVEVCPLPVQILVGDMFRFSVEMSEHMPTTRLCKLHHMSHCQSPLYIIFNAIIQPSKGL